MVTKFTSYNTLYIDHNVVVNDHLALQKQIIESDDKLFNPGWFNPTEYTIYNVRHLGIE